MTNAEIKEINELKKIIAEDERVIAEKQRTIDYLTEIAINGLIVDREKLTKQVSDFIRNLNDAVQKMNGIKRPTTYDEMYELELQIENLRFMAFGTDE